MSVQAQYPSNILLLNRNGRQDRKNMIGSNYSLQQEAIGFHDQSHMFFNSEGTNPRKRGREIATEEAPSNLFSLQSQLPNKSNVVSTAFPSSILSSFLSEEIFSQIKQHSDEIDQFIQEQADQLRRTLVAKREKHYHALLGVAEESASRRLKEKDVEVEKAVRRNAELEERVAQLRVEAQVWQAQARAQEATAASLQAQLQDAIMNGGAHDKRDERFRCGGAGESPAEDAESAYVDPERVDSSGPICKACRKGVASVVVLPCRHLCLCRDCVGTVEACPLCLSLTSASVEVYLS